MTKLKAHRVAPPWTIRKRAQPAPPAPAPPPCTHERAFVVRDAPLRQLLQTCPVCFKMWSVSEVALATGRAAYWATF